MLVKCLCLLDCIYIRSFKVTVFSSEIIFKITLTSMLMSQLRHIAWMYHSLLSCICMTMRLKIIFIAKHLPRVVLDAVGDNFHCIELVTFVNLFILAFCVCYLLGPVQL